MKQKERPNRPRSILCVDLVKRHYWENPCEIHNDANGSVTVKTCRYCKAQRKYFASNNRHYGCSVSYKVATT